ncbi:berberine bridge enzyme-like 26 [Phoenix dactylifera]|uniref:Berberine bridge enzyme-like 26 n=1 Tax=Phoenix dactylifera TaxID=42345 RepID=A0A8B8J6X1_PHODC|nr:berberine bridge enzyme-like 26 [Phoenix dactylifera]
MYWAAPALYSSLLESSIKNLRFASPSSSKPRFIVVPTNESHIQASVICCRSHRLSIRTQSGGHDYEGLSFRSEDDEEPFVLVDLANLRSVSVDVQDNVAWVQAGATLGELYYWIAKKSSTHAFPAGLCPSVGVGGHFSGGGFGTLLRKYGLSADNILDAKLVDADGRLLDRESMGEDLFWAIRGGGGASFGVIVSWKIRLVPVPQRVTVFTICKNLEQGAAVELINKWQYIAHKLPEDLYLKIDIRPLDWVGKEKAAVFLSLFLGKCGELLQYMGDSFPELGLKREDCREMSWIESVIYFASFYLSGDTMEALLHSRSQPKEFYKGKSDYVKEPIPLSGWEGICQRLLERENSTMVLTPHGGRMGEISEREIPYPHREGTLYNIHYAVWWDDGGASENNLGWIRRLHRHMTPYVSKHPRAAYLNYRDLDLGRNEKGNTSYATAEVWGRKYFKDNFKRLAIVKAKVDPENFFRNEQSIPPFHAKKGDEGWFQGVRFRPQTINKPHALINNKLT